MTSFKDFNLEEKILKILLEIGYENPTPIQAQAIPLALEGKDLMASAQTGTGKTAAFMLPCLDRITKTPRGAPKQKGPKVVVLVPTRELAMQVAKETEKYCRHLPFIKTVCIYGGVPYPIQNRALAKPYDILVATPGRLIDHLERGKIDLSKVQVLILDEADRMLDMGFVEPVEEIASKIPSERQTLLFSATLDKKILKFSQKLQNNPAKIAVDPQRSENQNITQVLYYVDNLKHKLRLLDHLLKNTEIQQAIIFTATKRQAEELSRNLRDNDYHAGALHGDMSQGQRSRTIDKLRKGTIQLLVATDVAARGIDIPALSHVINIDLPFQAEDYIHRIGRTGRAGAKGMAITFATYREKEVLTNIQKLLSAPLEFLTVEGLEPKPKGEEPAAPAKKRSFSRQPNSRHPGSRYPGSKRPFSKGPFPKRPFSERSRIESGTEQSGSERSSSDRPFPKRPFSERSGSERSGNERSNSERPFPKRPFSERSGSERSSSDRPVSERSGPNRSGPGGKKFFGQKRRPPFKKRATA